MMSMLSTCVPGIYLIFKVKTCHLTLVNACGVVEWFFSSLKLTTGEHILL